MSFLRTLFGKRRVDGHALVRSPHMADYAQIALLGRFEEPALPHPAAEHRYWNRILPRSYEQQLVEACRQGWLQPEGDHYRVTPEGRSLLVQYRARMDEARGAAMEAVRQALAQRDASGALEVRRQYEALHPPLGKADWTGPEPQMSHSALTRRVLFLDHWLLDGLGPDTVEWLRMLAAEQHLWGAFWPLPAEKIPPPVLADLQATRSASDHGLPLDGPDLVYWRAYQLALYVENQETWQRCKGGDHVRRLRIVNPYGDDSCDHCGQTLNQESLVARVPELPHRECTSVRGCLCQYEPVLETYEEDDPENQ